MKQSSIAFSVRHLMVSKVRGTFGTFSGATTVAEGGTPPVSAGIDVASVNTGNEQREAPLRSVDVFNVEKFPTGGFRCTGVQAKGYGYVLDGEFTLEGITSRSAWR